MWYKPGLWHVGGYIFWKTVSKVKVCVQKFYQGFTLVKQKRRKQNFPEGDVEPWYRSRNLIQHYCKIRSWNGLWGLSGVSINQSLGLGPPRSWPRGRYCSIPLTTQTVFSPLIWNVTLKIYEVICFSISGAQTLVFLFLWYWLNSSKM